MLKYIRAEVTFGEVPSEVSLCIWISGCPRKCEGCHSPELREDIGTGLSHKEIRKLIKKNKGITCVCLLGGDRNPGKVLHVMNFIKNEFPALTTAWYSGNEGLHPLLQPKLNRFDYIKLGPYIKEKGPLTSRTTNQKFFKVIEKWIDDKSYYYDLEDITYKFWKDGKDRD